MTLPQTRRDPPTSVSNRLNYGETFTQDELLCEETTYSLQTQALVASAGRGKARAK